MSDHLFNVSMALFAISGAIWFWILVAELWRMRP